MTILFAAPIEQYPVHLAITTTPTAINTAAGFPPSNVLTYDPTQIVKFNTNGGTLTWDFGIAREFDFVAIIHTNIDLGTAWYVDTSPDGTTWTRWAGTPTTPALSHIGATNPSWTGELNDPRLKMLERNTAFYSGVVISTRWMRVVVNGLSNPLTIGRLLVGRKFSPAKGYQYGSTFQFGDTGKKDRTDQGALVMNAGKSLVNASVKMDFLSKSEMYDYVYDFNYWRGSTREMFVCLDVEDVVNRQKNSLYCTISEGRTIVADQFNLYSQTWNIESIA